MESMTLEQQILLTKTLPEYILREHGDGFAMDIWIGGKAGHEIIGDDIVRVTPVCGSVSCIGGSANMILFGREVSPEETSASLGLSPQEGHGLFYHWNDWDDRLPYAWPLSAQREYEDAETPLEKAEVAARFCKLVGETKGSILHRDLGEYDDDL